MNQTHLEQVFQSYLEKFDEMNLGESTEWKKWQTAKEFPAAMNRALETPDAAFPEALQQALKLTAYMFEIQHSHPIFALRTYAEQEPAKVRAMFRDLYGDDGGDLVRRTKKLRHFLDVCETLRERYLPGENSPYKNNTHTVTGWLAFYDPDHNYLYKPMDAKTFRDIVASSEDWGAGQDFELAPYYRMCDALVEAIQAHPALLEEREHCMERVYEKYGIRPEDLYPDPKHHILAFDIIYACKHHKIAKSFEIQKTSVRAHRSVQQPQAVDLANVKAKYLAAEQREKRRQEAVKYILKSLPAGTAIHHTALGDGVVKGYDAKYGIQVDFSGAGERGLRPEFVGLKVDKVAGVPDFAQQIEAYRDILENGMQIHGDYQKALENFQQHREEIEAQE